MVLQLIAQMESLSSFDPSIVAALGVVVTMLAGSLVLMAKTLIETRQVNAAVNSVPEGEGLFAQIATLQVGVDRLLLGEEDFVSKGWRSLPEDLNSGAKLTQAIRDLQSFDKQVEEALLDLRGF